MSESGWGTPEWRADGERREGLPDLDDLPIAEHGYDREAVRDAFDRFYRHAAQLDSTLRVLESVEAFSRQARELRADIRSLRAASWGPAPSARHVWALGHEAWAPEEPPGALAASLPRLAIWAILIVAVGVGAALAELRTIVIVGLVAAAWALVGLIELVIASRRAAAVPAPLAPAQPAPAVARPQTERERAVLPGSRAPEPAVAAQETMIAPPADTHVEAAAAAPAEVEVEEREPASPAVPEPVPSAAVAAEPALVEAVDAPAAEPPSTDVAEPEPAVAAGDVPTVDEDGGKRRFWRRRRQRADETDEALAPAALGGWAPEEHAGDPWEHGVDENGGREPLEAAAPPSRGLLRRGRR